MATRKVNYSDIMNMKYNDFKAFVAERGHKEQVKEIASLQSEQKVYPRVKVWNEEKAKYVSVADKTQPYKIVVKPLTFFEIKAVYAEKVLKLAKKGDAKKPTFRDDIANW